MADKNERPQKIVADNHKARFNYEIGETFEAGVALTGSEVKSLRAGKATIAESYADARDGVVARLAEMGYLPAEPENPYWAARGGTVEDPDGWRVVLMNTEGI